MNQTLDAEQPTFAFFPFACLVFSAGQNAKGLQSLIGAICTSLPVEDSDQSVKELSTGGCVLVD